MNWWAIFGAGLLAGATTCAVAQGGLLVGLITRQKKAAGAATAPGKGPAADDLVPVAGFLLGKLVILTAAGALLGSLGSFIAPDSRIGGQALLLAAAIMIVFGLGAAGVPGFKAIVFAPPASWTRVVRKSTRSQSAFAPFLLGLATVLIPCGVTISMMLLAATAGSAAAGGAVMALFVLGTAPMFAAYGFLTQRYVSPDSRRMSIALGAVVVAMGLFTLNAGLVVLASPITAQTIASSMFGQQAAAAPAAPAPPLADGVQVLRIDARSGGYSPQSIAATSGVPTKLVIHTDNTQSCIVFTVFPTIGKQIALPGSGDTEIDLGTLTAGEVPISCSMGMYTGTIVVS
jgi:sulfite exporter TauE/SafE